YRLCDIAFIGGSLAARGGHNPFEAARLGCAVLFGPDTDNCAAMASALLAAGAAATVTGDSLARAVAELLDDPPLVAARAAAGRRVAAAGGGVVDAVLGRLAPWLDRLAPREEDAAALRKSTNSPVVVPAKAGTHSSATPHFSSAGTALPTMTGTCRGAMDPGLRRGDK
ncbi:MAG TPA: hypothetical protein VE993_16935, partial [Stellaceae bacterium]|nr:hypothetical protein [Stellaceae bacterium]